MGNGISYLPQAVVTLAKSILEGQNVRSTTLPPDFNYDPSNMVQLFLKPSVKVRRRRKSRLGMDEGTRGRI